MAIAPDTAGPHGPKGFNQQLQDARESLTSQSDGLPGVKTGSTKRAAVRGANKKEAAQPAGSPPVTIQTATPPAPLKPHVGGPVLLGDGGKRTDASTDASTDVPMAGGASPGGRDAMLRGEADQQDDTTLELMGKPAVNADATQSLPDELAFAMKLQLESTPTAPGEAIPNAKVNAAQPLPSGPTPETGTPPASAGVAAAIESISTADSGTAPAPIRVPARNAEPTRMPAAAISNGLRLPRMSWADPAKSVQEPGPQTPADTDRAEAKGPENGDPAENAPEAELPAKAALSPNSQAAVAATPSNTWVSQAASMKVQATGKMADASSSEPKTKGQTSAGTNSQAEVRTSETGNRVAAVQNTKRAQVGDRLPEPAPHNETFVRTATLQASDGPSIQRTESTTAGANAKAAGAASLMSPEPAAKAPAPVKELSIQVGQTQQDRVQLRVVERAGELQVAVRANNPEMTQGLRQGLSQLADRLEQSGFRTDTWRPGSNVSTVQSGSESRQKQADPQNNGSQSQSGGSQQERRQGNQQQSRPQWVMELDGNLHAAEEPATGESHGISR